MTDISPTERQVFPLTAGRNVFLAGMDWKTLPASHKNPRTFARSLGAVRYISCEYLSTEDTDRHIMVAAVSQNTIPKGSRRYFSLAMLILPLLEQEDTLSLNCHRQTIQNFMVLFLLLTASWSVTWWEPGRKSGRPGKYSSPLTARLNTAGHVMNRPRLTGLTAEVPCHWKPDRCREISGRSTPSPRIPWATAYSGITHTHPSGYCMVWLAVL